MWLLQTTREELVDKFRQALRGELRDARRVEDKKELLANAKGFCLLWNEPPDRERFLPAVVLVENGQKRDLLAWIGTYIPTLRPFTHLAHVLERKNLEQIVARDKIGSSKRYIAAAVGLVIAEATTQKLVTNTRRPLSYTDYLETFAFCFTRALLSGATFEELETLFRTWVKAQILGGHFRSPHEDLDKVIAPFAILAALCDRVPSHNQNPVDGEIFSVVQEISKNGKISRQLQTNIARSSSLPVQLFDGVSEGTRESRVQALEEALLFVAKGIGVRPSIGMFIAGYLVSQVAPGSLEYMSLITSATQVHSEMTLWYGLLAGLHPDGNILDFEGGLGWHIASELIRSSDPFSRPVADMDIVEFEMLSGSERSILGQGKFQGSFSIELIPGSETTVKIAPSNISQPEAQRGLFESERLTHESTQLLSDINAAMRNLQQIRLKIERITGKPGTPESRRKK